MHVWKHPYLLGFVWVWFRMLLLFFLKINQPASWFQIGGRQTLFHKNRKLNRNYFRSATKLLDTSGQLNALIFLSCFSPKCWGWNGTRFWECGGSTGTNRTGKTNVWPHDIGSLMCFLNHWHALSVPTSLLSWHKILAHQMLFVPSQVSVIVIMAVPAKTRSLGHPFNTILTPGNLPLLTRPEFSRRLSNLFTHLNKESVLETTSTRVERSYLEDHPT